MSRENSPFKFLDSYQQADADVFFGREKETHDLYNALSGVKHLMVYGPSGSGKTSLVECGLRNQFSDADWYAITIRKSADINASVFASINNALKEKIETDPVTRMPVDPGIEFGQAVEKLFVERYQPVYLLFDQFEELLISGEEAEKKKFFTLLNKLIRNKVPCRIMLIMREEFIGHLSEFELLCPSIFQHRFRVEKMGRKHVEDVIYHILEAPRYRAHFNVDDSHKLAESILSKLPDRKKEIELAHVQVFLGELWDRAQTANIKNELPFLSADLIHDDDNLEAVLESFLKKQMAELEGSYGERVPLELLAAMISERFTKLQLSEAAIKADLEQKKVVASKPIIELLQELEHRRILRTLKAGDETQYEISHDVLALVVGQNLTEAMKMREKAGDIYKVYQERQGLFTQDDIDYLRPFQQSLPYPPDLQARLEESIDQIRKNRNKELAKTRKRRTLYIILGVVSIALVSTGYFGYISNRAKKEAEAQKILAEEQRVIAIEQQQIAEEIRHEAEYQRAIALEDKKEALIQKMLAENISEELKIETLKTQSLTLAYFAEDQLDKNPTLAIRLAELAWQKYSTNLPDLPVQKIVFKGYHEPLENKKLFYKNKLLHDGRVNSAEFSPDGIRIVTASGDNIARIWDAESGNLLYTLMGHKSEVNSGEFSPDGKMIVTASDDGTIKIWDTETGKVLHMRSGHGGAVYNAEFSPDGKRIVTASEDKTARIWDTETGMLLQTLHGHESGVYGAEPSLVGRNENRSKDYRVKSFTDIAIALSELSVEKRLVWRAEFSPDGKRIVTASGSNVASIWDAESGNLLYTLMGHDTLVNSADFSPNGKRIVTSSEDKTARIWDAETGKLLLTLYGHKYGVNSAKFSYDGLRILTGSMDFTAKIWDAESGELLHTLTGHESVVNSAEFSPDGRRIVTASGDFTSKLWNIESDKEPLHALTGHESWVNSAEFSPDGKRIVTASADKTARIWDVESGREIHRLSGHDSVVHSALFSPNGQKIVTASWDRTAKIWDAESGDTLYTLKGHKGPVLSALFSPNGQKIVTASWDRTAKIWDAESGREIRMLSGHEGRVNSAEFSPDGKRILTASDDKTARIWDAETGKEFQMLIGHEADVFSAKISHDGKKILTASQDQTARIWDAESGRLIQTLSGHGSVFISAAFSPDGKWIVTASQDKTARIWDAESGREIQTLSGHEDGVTSAEFSPDGKKIVTTSDDHTARIWLTAEGIIDWLGKQENIYKLTDKDLEDLGIDFIDLDE